MHKAGGIIALIAGVLSIFALIATVFFSAADAVLGETTDAGAKGAELGGHLMGGVFSIAIVVVLSIVILNTRTRWPGIIMAIVCFLVMGFNSAGTFVSICLAFALLGALMSLNLGRTATNA